MNQDYVEEFVDKFITKSASLADRVSLDSICDRLEWNKLDRDYKWNVKKLRGIMKVEGFVYQNDLSFKTEEVNCRGGWKQMILREEDE
jgi:hypothetical protein